MIERTILKSIACATLLIVSSRALATTVLVVTDEPKAAKAQEVAALFRTTEPFSLMTDLTLKVIATSSAKLGCVTAPITTQDLAFSPKNLDADELLARSEWRDRGAEKSLTGWPSSCNPTNPPAARLISCDTPQAVSYLGALAKTEKAKYIVIVKTDARYGGSGGTYPVITTASPASMALHELLHQLGFADEYAYPDACEADMYCADRSSDSISASGYGLLPGTAFNVAAFNARPSYSSNADVRKIHNRDIPWLSFVDASTDLINAGKLGSTPKPDEIGLFRSNVCDNATKQLETWQSTTDATVMKTLTTTYIPKDYWATIAKSLGTHVKP